MLRLLALRQPMARDLREILAALRIASDIERIGDYAANVAKRSMALNLTPPLLGTRAACVRWRGWPARQVRDVLRGLPRPRRRPRHGACAPATPSWTPMYTGLFRELLTYMMEDPRQITPCTHLLFIAKNLERIGDHATNIAENIWFLVHGEQPQGEREKRDTTAQ